MYSVLLLVAFLVLPRGLALLVALVYIAVQFALHHFAPKGENPFKRDERKPRKAYELDHKKRDAVIKQSFSAGKVPEDLDAVIIGSGIGGLAAAAVMAKAGKKVVVLEQHDQAGGCCHTFIDKGYEFDVGIHYIGDIDVGCLNRTLVDQITDGQLEWHKLDDAYDRVSIGYGDARRQYPVVHGKQNWMRLLKEQFPKEKVAIDRFFELLDACNGASKIIGMLKLMPLWAARILVKSGAIHLFTNFWKGDVSKSTIDIISELTTDPDLRIVLCYCYGDYGTAPDKSMFLMQALLNNHFMRKGAFYPVGGASEIALNIIPVIERSGGKVLVRAEVTRILVENGQAVGVRVKKGNEEHEVRAKVVVSGAGVYNTFQTLLPREIAQQSYFSDIARDLKPGVATMNVFLGLNASNEELNLKGVNTWAFPSVESALDLDKYMNKKVESAMESEVPLLFVSFPSAKDPNWKLRPERENKSTCAIVTLANWDWFKKFANTSLKKRGDEYDEIKKAIGDMMIEQACKLFPQIKHHIDFIEIGSPVTNQYYIAQPHGEIYGLDHAKERFDPWMLAQLRPQTDVPGLYLTGQDVMACGFTGALNGGVFAAGAILGRIAFNDLEALHKELYPSK